jgi:hypothetical protein
MGTLKKSPFCKGGFRGIVWGIEHREETKKFIWIPDIRLRRIPE